MQQVSIDEAKTSLENQLALPLPGRRVKVSEAVVEDEMALFKTAAAGR